MSPRQVVVLPLSKAHVAYAERVKEALRVDDSIKWVDVDMRDETLNRKIRDAQTSQANYILVVGPQEESTGTVHVRHREKGVLGAMNVEELRQKVVHEIKEFTNV
jgi:threonyl-tRNA synthetase